MGSNYLKFYSLASDWYNFRSEFDTLQRENIYIVLGSELLMRCISMNYSLGKYKLFRQMDDLE